MREARYEGLTPRARQYALALHGRRDYFSRLSYGALKNSADHPGVHQGVDQAIMFSQLDEFEMTRKYR